MGAHLAQEPKTLDDPVVEVYEFCLAEVVDIDPLTVFSSDSLRPNAGGQPRRLSASAALAC